MIDVSRLYLKFKIEILDCFNVKDICGYRLTYKQKLAKNPNTSKKILDILSFDRSWYVRYCVATNINSTPEIFERLYNETEWFTTSAIRLNHSTPNYIKLYWYYSNCPHI